MDYRMDEKEKQLVICRQSQLKFVMDYSKQIGKPLKLKEMVRISNVLVDYCINGNTKEINDTVGKIDDYLEKLFENE
jgi:hypothetical protein